MPNTYNLHHTHHKRESFAQRMRDAFKAWRYKYSKRMNRPSHDKARLAERLGA